MSPQPFWLAGVRRCRWAGPARVRAVPLPRKRRVCPRQRPAARTVLRGVGGSEMLQDRDLPAVLTRNLQGCGPGSGRDFPQSRRSEPIVDSPLVSHKRSPRVGDRFERSTIGQNITQLWNSGHS